MSCPGMAIAMQLDHRVLAETEGLGVGGSLASEMRLPIDPVE